MIDKMAIMEIIWYAAQFKAIAEGKNLIKTFSLKSIFKYLKGNLTAVVKGQINSRKSA